MTAASPTPAPIVLKLTITRFRGIPSLKWYPARGLNVILGGGDVGKSTILDAIARLLSPTNAAAITDADFWKREAENGLEITAVMSLPTSTGIHSQSKQAWPWDWNGEAECVPTIDESGAVVIQGTPVFVLRVRATADFEVFYEIIQPDGAIDTLSTSIRRAIGLVRLGGDDRNDRDLRLVQGSALDRLLSDKSLRARLGVKLGGDEVKEQLKPEAKERLGVLDERFKKQALPSDLSLGLTSGQGFSIGALIGLTASEEGIRLPLSSWGAGTRRLASLEIAAACQGADPVTLVDEVERGLEPYRQRVLIGILQESSSQIFLTTHSAVAISAATKATLWYMDANSAIGALPWEKISRQQTRDPEALLARLTIVAEGDGEKGFLRRLLERAGLGRLHERGLWITDAQGNDSALNLLEALASGGLQFGAFVDNEGKFPTRWAAIGEKLGALFFQWGRGCIEDNIVPHIPDEKLEAFIVDPSGEHTGERLRTLADRLDLRDDKSFATIKAAAPDLRALILESATGKVPASKANASDPEKKALRSHQRCWFKSYDGGFELADKIFALGLWPQLRARLLPFVNAILAAENMAGLTDIS
jgi:putative ATP-dependent endonuclease of OLD family